MVYVAAFSYVNHLFVEGLIATGLVPLQLLLFYLSRYKRLTYLSFTVYTLVVYVFFVYNFTWNSGLEGPSFLSFLSVYFLSLAISKKRHYLVWSFINFSIVAGVVLLQRYWPDLVVNTYENKDQRLIDWVSTYVVTAVLLFACITYIINNYQKEQEKVESWAIELDQLNDEKSTLLKIVAHDFQSPLLGIKHYLEIMRQHGLEEDDRKHFEEEMSRSLADTQRLLISLLESEKHGVSQSASPSLFNVSVALKPLFNVYRDIASSRKIELKTDIPESLLLNIKKHAFEVIVRNLLDNAIKNTPDNGNVSVIFREEYGLKSFLIHNSGPAMPEHTQLLVKRCLQNEPSELSTIGIRLVARFAALANIVVDLNSAAEEGTSFTLIMPNL